MSFPARPLAPLPGFIPVGTCAAPNCREIAPGARFCDGCFADAAKDCARLFEALLIDCGAAPGSDELKAALAGYDAPRGWYETESMLGTLSYAEALRLRTLTESACLLVALGGVAALDRLPGTRSADPGLDFSVSMARVAMDWGALPARRRAGLRRKWSLETRFQIGTLAVLLLCVVVLAVTW